MKVSASGAATTVDGRALTMKAAPQGTSTSMIRPSKSADGGSRLLSTRKIDPEHAKLTPQEFHARGLHLKHARKLTEDDPAASLMNGNGEDSMFLSTQELQLLEGTADKVADGSATLEMKKAYYELALRTFLVTHTHLSSSPPSHPLNTRSTRSHSLGEKAVHMWDDEKLSPAHIAPQ